MTQAWTEADVRAIAAGPDNWAPLIGKADVRPLLAGMHVWDMWPLAHADGATACVAGGVLWFALAAPVRPDPEERHAQARIRLLLQRGAGRDATWVDCGNALPDGMNPGSREWSGSAVLEAGSGRVVLYYTVAGRLGEAAVTFEQRLFEAAGRLVVGAAGSDGVRVEWDGAPRACVAMDGVQYRLAVQQRGAPGEIDACRDPAYFRDPADGRGYLLFAATLADAGDPMDGAVGLAVAEADGRWRLLPPLVHARGVNKELERPHMVYDDGRYYLFWSTQRHTFARGLAAPTGLYGMVADGLCGPYRPLNGSGLVIANPPAAPAQAYSWWVLGDLRVTSFIDRWIPAEGGARPFGGTAAPFLQLRLCGERSWVSAAD